MGRAQRRQAERDHRKANRTQPGAVTAIARGSAVIDPRPAGVLSSALPRQRGKGQGELGTPAIFASGVFGTTSVAVGAPEPRRAPEVLHRTAPEPLPAHERVDVQSLEVTAAGCETLADVEPQALGLTYWFDAAPEGEPYAVTVRFTGRLTARRGDPGDNDASTTFIVDESVADVLPGSGHVALTTRVGELATGVWAVRAQVVATTERARQRGATRVHTRSPGAVSPGATASGSTGWAHGIRERAPGVRAGVWPALVAIGAVVALGIQARLGAQAALPSTQLFVLSVIACLVGLIGAKLYYLIQPPQDVRVALRSGMCLQGFVIAAMATVVAGALIEGISAGPLLDVTAPGLAIGMAIGRVGCFFAGCCAGRPTASRWGRWSSNRRLGLRRIPVQLVESVVALLIGAAALVAVATATVHPSGVVFTAVIAAYTLARQLLFPLRDLPRKTALGRLIVTAVSVVVLISAIALALLS